MPQGDVTGPLNRDGRKSLTPARIYEHKFSQLKSLSMAILLFIKYGTVLDETIIQIIASAVWRRLEV